MLIACSLARLPFASASFDHVRVSAIDRAVPAYAWPGLLAEIARVLQPSGTLAMTADGMCPNPSGNISHY